MYRFRPRRFARSVRARSHSTQKTSVAIHALEPRVLMSIVRPDHVVIVMEQDRAADMIGSSIMPYLSQLAASGLVYTNSHSVTHPTQPNLLGLFSGSTQGVISNSQGFNYPTQNNLAKQLFDAGFSFAGYTENLPANGSQVQQAGDATWPDLYLRYINPMAMFGNYGIDPNTSQARANAIVNKTFGAFSSIPTGDYSTLPTVSLIIPNCQHSTHGSNEAYPWAGSDDDADNNRVLREKADTWLHDNLDPYVQWAKTHNSLLVVTGDEERYIGGTAGSISTIVAGDSRLVTPGVNPTYINHYNLLRTVQDMYGLPTLGASASASAYTTDAGGKLVPVAAPAPVGTTIALSSGVNPSITGQSVTFTATVTPKSAGQPTPTGIVSFMDGATLFGTGTLNASGVATFSTSALSTGTHKLTVAYAGDARYLASATTITQTVTNVVGTTTAVTSLVNPSVKGQPVTFRATVSPASGSGTPTGTVQFIVDGANFGSPVTLSGGIATSAAATSMTVGSHSVKAVYNGSTSYSASTSSTIAQSVLQASTATALTSSANPSVVGQSVTLTATVSTVAPGSGVASGTVSFFDGSVLLGTGTLDTAGVATLTSKALTLGAHALTANYSGDSGYSSSTSATLTQTVNDIPLTPSATSVASSAPSAVSGQALTFTATVTAATGTPTGTVQFVIDGSNYGSPIALVSGVASVGGPTTLAVGSHTISAIYGGDATYSGSTATAVSQSIAKAATSATVTTSLNPSQQGQFLTLTATVLVTAPGSGIATGTVTFKDGSTTLGTGTLDASGSARLSTSSLTAGTHGITVVYAGDARFSGTTSPALSQRVNAVTGAPANDGFANAIVVTGSATTASGANTKATKETGEPNHGGNKGGKSVWWTWTAASTGKVQIDTVGSSFDTLLGVYTGTAVNALSLVPGGSNDDDWANNTWTSKVIINVTLGTQYRIAVDGYNGAAGNITLRIGVVPALGATPEGTLSPIKKRHEERYFEFLS